MNFNLSIHLTYSLQLIMTSLFKYVIFTPLFIFLAGASSLFHLNPFVRVANTHQSRA